MNRLKRWQANIITNLTEHTLFTVLFIAMYIAFIKTVFDLLKWGLITWEQSLLILYGY